MREKNRCVFFCADNTLCMPKERKQKQREKKRQQQSKRETLWGLFRCTHVVHYSNVISTWKSLMLTLWLIVFVATHCFYWCFCCCFYFTIRYTQRKNHPTSARSDCVRFTYFCTYSCFSHFDFFLFFPFVFAVCFYVFFLIFSPSFCFQPIYRHRFGLFLCVYMNVCACVCMWIILVLTIEIIAAIFAICGVYGMDFGW